MAPIKNKDDTRVDLLLRKSPFDKEDVLNMLFLVSLERLKIESKFAMVISGIVLIT